MSGAASLGEWLASGLIVLGASFALTWLLRSQIVFRHRIPG